MGKKVSGEDWERVVFSGAALTLLFPLDGQVRQNAYPSFKSDLAPPYMSHDTAALNILLS